MASSIYDNIFVMAYSAIVDALGQISWKWLAKLLNGNGKYYKLTESEQKQIADLLSKNYMIIATRRNYTLSTYMIVFASWVGNKYQDRPFYDHVLLNVEEDSAENMEDLWFEEATGKGVHYSKFMEVFDCDSVALLKPKNMALSDWNSVVAKAVSELGKPYDDVFNINDDSHLSCVELVLDGLKAAPDFETKFPNLCKMIAKAGNITPQMFRDCEDFEVVFEAKH